MSKAGAWGLGGAGLVLLLDQASKWLLLTAVMAPPRAIEVTGFFNVVPVWNRGVSFGLFGAQALSPWVFIGISAAIAAALTVWLVRAGTWFEAAAIGLILGGAIGNIVDRLVHGAVFDFLDFHVAGYHWPAFNLADSAITMGALLLVADSLFLARRRHT
ncbi:MAG: signal peptidase II [Alphaproteobacteria bacterium]|nr:signal peptidase II [Alphaproteobacteria bacterium]